MVECSGLELDLREAAFVAARRWPSYINSVSNMETTVAALRCCLRHAVEDSVHPERFDMARQLVNQVGSDLREMGAARPLTDLMENLRHPPWRVLAANGSEYLAAFLQSVADRAREEGGGSRGPSPEEPA